MNCPPFVRAAAWIAGLVLLGTTGCTQTSGPVAPRQPVAILCVGDSITQGGKRDREEFTYRLALQRLMYEAGVRYDFLGTRQQGLHADALWPDVAPGVPFDPDHEGYYGAKTARVCAQVIEHLPALPPPDVALIHLGTNDQKTSAPETDVVQPLEELIGALRVRNPAVIVLVGHLNFNDSQGAHAIRPAVEAMVARLSRPESPVVSVHHYQGWHERPREPESDTFDWAHPNPQGQARMAANWFAAMAPFLRSKQAGR